MFDLLHNDWMTLRVTLALDDAGVDDVSLGVAMIL